MIRIALAVRFSPDDQHALEQVQAQALGTGSLRTLTDLPFSMNLASWLLPSTDAVDTVLKAVADTQQLDLAVFPTIELVQNNAIVSLQPIMTHILNVWHFNMHKALELPYLADDERDVPKRWRPSIQIGQAATLPTETLPWPKSLRCDQFMLYNKDTNEIVAEQALTKMTAIPW